MTHTFIVSIDDETYPDLTIQIMGEEHGRVGTAPYSIALTSFEPIVSTALRRAVEDVLKSRRAKS